MDKGISEKKPAGGPRKKTKMTLGEYLKSVEDLICEQHGNTCVMNEVLSALMDEVASVKRTVVAQKRVTGVLEVDIDTLSTLKSRHDLEIGRLWHEIRAIKAFLSERQDDDDDSPVQVLAKYDEKETTMRCFVKGESPTSFQLNPDDVDALRSLDDDMEDGFDTMENIIGKHRGKGRKPESDRKEGRKTETSAVSTPVKRKRSVDFEAQDDSTDGDDATSDSQHDLEESQVKPPPFTPNLTDLITPDEEDFDAMALTPKMYGQTQHHVQRPQGKRAEPREDRSQPYKREAIPREERKVKFENADQGKSAQVYAGDEVDATKPSLEPPPFVPDLSELVSLDDVDFDEMFHMPRMYQKALKQKKKVPLPRGKKADTPAERSPRADGRATDERKARSTKTEKPQSIDRKEQSSPDPWVQQWSPVVPDLSLDREKKRSTDPWVQQGRPRVVTDPSTVREEQRSPDPWVQQGPQVVPDPSIAKEQSSTDPWVQQWSPVVPDLSLDGEKKRSTDPWVQQGRPPVVPDQSIVTAKPSTEPWVQQGRPDPSTVREEQSSTDPWVQQAPPFVPDLTELMALDDVDFDEMAHNPKMYRKALKQKKKVPLPREKKAGPPADRSPQADGRATDERKARSTKTEKPQSIDIKEQSSPDPWVQEWHPVVPDLSLVREEKRSTDPWVQQGPQVVPDMPIDQEERSVVSEEQSSTDPWVEQWHPVVPDLSLVREEKRSTDPWVQQGPQVVQDLTLDSKEKRSTDPWVKQQRPPVVPDPSIVREEQSSTDPWVQQPPPFVPDLSELMALGDEDFDDMFFNPKMYRKAQKQKKKKKERKTTQPKEKTARQPRDASPQSGGRGTVDAGAKVQSQMKGRQDPWVEDATTSIKPPPFIPNMDDLILQRDDSDDLAVTPDMYKKVSKKYKAGTGKTGADPKDADRRTASRGSDDRSQRTTAHVGYKAEERGGSDTELDSSPQPWRDSSLQPETQSRSPAYSPAPPFAPNLSDLITPDDEDFDELAFSPKMYGRAQKQSARKPKEGKKLIPRQADGGFDDDTSSHFKSKGKTPDTTQTDKAVRSRKSGEKYSEEHVQALRDFSEVIVTYATTNAQMQYINEQRYQQGGVGGVAEKPSAERKATATQYKGTDVSKQGIQQPPPHVPRMDDLLQQQYDSDDIAVTPDMFRKVTKQYRKGADRDAGVTVSTKRVGDTAAGGETVKEDADDTAGKTAQYKDKDGDRDGKRDQRYYKETDYEAMPFQDKLHTVSGPREVRHVEPPKVTGLKTDDRVAVQPPPFIPDLSGITQSVDADDIVFTPNLYRKVTKKYDKKDTRERRVDPLYEYEYDYSDDSYSDGDTESHPEIREIDMTTARFVKHSEVGAKGTSLLRRVAEIIVVSAVTTAQLQYITLEKAREKREQKNGRATDSSQGTVRQQRQDRTPAGTAAKPERGEYYQPTRDSTNAHAPPPFVPDIDSLILDDMDDTPLTPKMFAKGKNQYQYTSKAAPAKYESDSEASSASEYSYSSSGDDEMIADKNLDYGAVKPAFVYGTPVDKTLRRERKEVDARGTTQYARVSPMTGDVCQPSVQPPPHLPNMDELIDEHGDLDELAIKPAMYSKVSKGYKAKEAVYAPPAADTVSDDSSSPDEDADDHLAFQPAARTAQKDVLRQRRLEKTDKRQEGKAPRKDVTFQADTRGTGMPYDNRQPDDEAPFRPLPFPPNLDDLIPDDTYEEALFSPKMYGRVSKNYKQTTSSAQDVRRSAYGSDESGASSESGDDEFHSALTLAEEHDESDDDEPEDEFFSAMSLTPYAPPKYGKMSLSTPVKDTTRFDSMRGQHKQQSKKDTEEFDPRVQTYCQLYVGHILSGAQLEYANQAIQNTPSRGDKLQKPSDDAHGGAREMRNRASAEPAEKHTETRPACKSPRESKTPRSKQTHQDTSTVRSDQRSNSEDDKIKPPPHVPDMDELLSHSVDSDDVSMTPGMYSRATKGYKRVADPGKTSVPKSERKNILVSGATRDKKVTKKVTKKVSFLDDMMDAETPVSHSRPEIETSVRPPPHVPDLNELLPGDDYNDLAFSPKLYGRVSKQYTVPEQRYSDFYNYNCTNNNHIMTEEVKAKVNREGEFYTDSVGGDYTASYGSKTNKEDEEDSEEDEEEEEEEREKEEDDDDEFYSAMSLSGKVSEDSTGEEFFSALSLVDKSDAAEVRTAYTVIQHDDRLPERFNRADDKTSRETEAGKISPHYRAYSPFCGDVKLSSEYLRALSRVVIQNVLAGAIMKYARELREGNRNSACRVVKAGRKTILSIKQEQTPAQDAKRDTGATEAKTGEKYSSEAEGKPVAKELMCPLPYLPNMDELIEKETTDDIRFTPKLFGRVGKSGKPLSGQRTVGVRVQVTVDDVGDDQDVFSAKAKRGRWGYDESTQAAESNYDALLMHFSKIFVAHVITGAQLRFAADVGVVGSVTGGEKSTPGDKESAFFVKDKVTFFESQAEPQETVKSVGDGKLRQDKVVIKGREAVMRLTDARDQEVGAGQDQELEEVAGAANSGDKNKRIRNATTQTRIRSVRRSLRPSQREREAYENQRRRAGVAKKDKKKRGFILFSFGSKKSDKKKSDKAKDKIDMYERLMKREQKLLARASAKSGAETPKDVSGAADKIKMYENLIKKERSAAAKSGKKDAPRVKHVRPAEKESPDERKMTSKSGYPKVESGTKSGKHSTPKKQTE